MKNYLVEICCGSADDVVQAAQGGADRVELNAGLFLGGLTPSAGSLRLAKGHTRIPVMCMLRPREGGFCYTPLEFETVLEDAHILLDSGADGLVFGFLREDGRVDEERCRRIIELAGQRETVFHRAIDVVPDWREALDILIGLGITRVLTSGQMPSALLGADTVAAMVDYAAGRIQILPGAGLRPENVEDFVQRTGCDQIHMSFHRVCRDDSAAGNPAIHFGGALYPPEDQYKMVDGERLTRFTQ